MNKKKTFVIIAFLLVIIIYWLYYRQRIYSPVFDPSPISSLKFSKVIDSVYSLPFDSSYTFEKSGPEILKTQFPQKKEYIMFRYNDSLVYVTLFYNHQDALDKYNSTMRSGTPVFSQSGIGYDKYFVQYVSQGRADQFGLFLPMKSYYCSSGFLKQNLVIYISSNFSNKRDDTLKLVVRDLGAVLKKLNN